MTRRHPTLSLLLVIALVFAPLQGAWAFVDSMPAGHGMGEQAGQSDHCAQQKAKAKAKDCCNGHDGVCGMVDMGCLSHCAASLIFVLPTTIPMSIARTDPVPDSEHQLHFSGFRPDLEHRPPKTA